MLLQIRYEGSHCRSLLSYGNINTVYRFACIIETLLINDSINCNGGLSGLTVTDDKLTLTTTNRNHGVNSLQTCLERLLYRLTVDNSGGFTVERHLKRLSKIKISLAVDGLSQWVDDATKHIVVHSDRRDTLSTFHNHAFFDTISRTEKHTTYVVLLKVHDDSHSTILKLQELVGFGITQSVDARYTIADLKHSAHLVELLAITDSFQLFEKHLGYFAWFNFI